MASMLIRNIPNDVIEKFRAQANKQGVSAEQFARDLITREAGMTRAEALARIDAIRKSSKRLNLEETMQMMEEMRAERDGRPFAGLPDDH